MYVYMCVFMNLCLCMYVFQIRIAHSNVHSYVCCVCVHSYVWGIVKGIVTGSGLGVLLCLFDGGRGLLEVSTVLRRDLV